MTIEYIPLEDTDYQSRRYSNILQLEQSGKVALTPYSDNPKYGGYPTIGAGFKIDSNWDYILTTLGLNPSDSVDAIYINKIKALIPPDSKFTGTQMDTLNTKLNAIMFERFSYYAAVYQDYTKRPTFAFADDAEVYATFQSIAATKETTLLDAWLSSAGVTVPMSDERLALFSLTYNNIIGFKDAAQTIPKSPHLLNALKDGDRLRAWYEIRYWSNLDKIQYKRRYGESDLFGIWDGATPTQTELTAFENFINQNDPYKTSLSILQSIRNYEADYNPHDTTILGLPISNSIDETINSSTVKGYFVSKYGMGKTIDGNGVLSIGV